MEKRRRKASQRGPHPQREHGPECLIGPWAGPRQPRVSPFLVKESSSNDLRDPAPTSWTCVQYGVPGAEDGKSPLASGIAKTSVLEGRRLLSPVCGGYPHPSSSPPLSLARVYPLPPPLPTTINNFVAELRLLSRRAPLGPRRPSPDSHRHRPGLRIRGCTS